MVNAGPWRLGHKAPPKYCKCLPISLCHISEDLNHQQHFLFITVYNGICMHHTPEYALTVKVWHLKTYTNVCACTCDYITFLHQVYSASKPKYPYGCRLLGLGTMRAGSYQMTVPASFFETVVQLYQVTWCTCQKTVSFVNNDVRTSSLITLRESILYH
jgi:hypothetical protein